MQRSEQISVLSIFLNLFLFLIKIAAGFFANSLAVISDAFNSFSDVISSIIIYFAVKAANKKPDLDHPFGHTRAEPIAGLVIAIFSGILGFEIIKTAVRNIIFGNIAKASKYTFIALSVSIIVKMFMVRYFSQKALKDRPAFKAASVDSRNDALVSLVALIGVGGIVIGIPQTDNIAAIFISIFIFYSGYEIAVENINYLMGKTPPVEYISSIRSAVKRVKGVKGVNELRAHYVGNKIHAEIHVEVDKKISTKESHDIGKKVQKTIEGIKWVGKAFIHIDPV